MGKKDYYIIVYVSIVFSEKYTDPILYYKELHFLCSVLTIIHYKSTDTCSISINKSKTRRVLKGS